MEKSLADIKYFAKNATGTFRKLFSDNMQNLYGSLYCLIVFSSQTRIQ